MKRIYKTFRILEGLNSSLPPSSGELWLFMCQTKQPKLSVSAGKGAGLSDWRKICQCCNV